MNRRRTTIVVISLCVAALLGASCGREHRSARPKAEYRRLAREAMAIYARTEPLRSSRIGLTASDSLLFTFSADEISRAVERLRKLENALSKLSVTGLTTTDADNAELMLYWCRGELFALEELRSFRYNPLLYCWVVEEALWGIPSRIRPPGPDELGAYRARLASIPRLLDNARALLDNPAEAHSRYATTCLDGIVASFPALEAATRERYGQSVGQELERSRQSVETFRAFIGATLLPRSRGKLILGSEYLSKVLLYGELINSDPNMIVGKAESDMRRLQSQRSGLERKIEYLKRGSLALKGSSPEGARGIRVEAASSSEQRLRPRPAAPAPRPVSRPGRSFEARATETLRRIAPDSALAGSARIDTATLEIRHPARTGRHSFLPTSQLLAIPSLERPLAEFFVTTAPEPASCRAYALFAAEADTLADGDLLALLLRATPDALEPDERCCESADSIRAIFSSETYREGWLSVAAREPSARLRAADPEVGIALIRDEILALARVVVVFRLHAGTLTSDDAAEYLVQSAGLGREEAEREVLAASVSPGVAYRGIAMILVEGMTETVAYVDGLDRPERGLADILRQNRGLPLPIISEKISRD